MFNSTALLKPCFFGTQMSEKKATRVSVFGFQVKRVFFFKPGKAEEIPRRGLRFSLHYCCLLSGDRSTVSLLLEAKADLDEPLGRTSSIGRMVGCGSAGESVVSNKVDEQHL